MKRGRHKIDEPKSIIFRLRLNEDYKNRLDFISEKIGKTKSEIVRDLIMKESYRLYYNKL